MTKKLSNRVPTGIKGFDNLVEGGFPKNSSILVCGGPGCGKTIFAMEFLVNGATKFKEKGLYVSFEQRADSMENQAAQFGWNTKALEKSGFLKILSTPASKITKNSLNEVKDYVRKNKIKRLVIDSLSTLVINAPIYTAPSEMAVEDVVGQNIVFSPPVIGDYVAKRFIYQLIEDLRNLDCTTILISEAGEKSEYITRDTLSEFACDGVVILSLQEILNMRRLQIRKLRSTIHPFRAKELNLLLRNSG
jgi:circadian clock protein KaiC